MTTSSVQKVQPFRLRCDNLDTNGAGGLLVGIVNRSSIVLKLHILVFITGDDNPELSWFLLGLNKSSVVGVVAGSTIRGFPFWIQAPWSEVFIIRCIMLRTQGSRLSGIESEFITMN